jgi:branched-chain amino acid aminotransferase
MAKIYSKAYFGDKIIPIEEANLSVASSAVLYGLSIYTVFPVVTTQNGPAAFRLEDHYERLVNSAKIIGIDTFEINWDYEKFKNAVKELVSSNELDTKVFVRATVHVSDLVAGTRSRGLNTILSMFIYEAKPIVPQDGARLKTSVWRRVPDYAIPSRAKVNGAYVNSVLGKQDAIDSGYDDCLFLDSSGHVCELSAANIFIVRDGVLYTPARSSDILEGINRKTVLEIAQELQIPTVEGTIDLTELYIAHEVFACGTSAFIAPVTEIDARKIGDGENPITKRIKEKYEQIFKGEDDTYLTALQ